MYTKNGQYLYHSFGLSYKSFTGIYHATPSGLSPEEDFFWHRLTQVVLEKGS